MKIKKIEILLKELNNDILPITPTLKLYQTLNYLNFIIKS